MIDIYRYFKNDGHESLKLVSRRHLHKKSFWFFKTGQDARLENGTHSGFNIR